MSTFGGKFQTTTFRDANLRNKTRLRQRTIFELNRSRLLANVLRFLELRFNVSDVLGARSDLDEAKIVYLQRCGLGNLKTAIAKSLLGHGRPKGCV